MPSFPFYKQFDIMDCGPTCLRMIAKHYGRSYSLQSLREKTQISRDGVTLLDISQAAEAIGFHTVGAKLDFETLATEVPLPCIVHWQQTHFVVVHQIKSPGFRFFRRRSSALADARVYVADPSRGMVDYSRGEFIAKWQNADSTGGVSLLFEPTPRFFEEPDETAAGVSFKQLFAYVLTGRYQRLLIQLFLGLFVGSLLQLLLPFLTQAVVDTGINTQNLNFIYLVLGAQIMLTIGRTSVDFIRSWILLHISARVSLSVLSDFLSKLMRLPLAFFDIKLFGDLMQRIGDQHRIEVFLTNTSLATLFSLFNLVVFGTVLLVYNTSIFLLFLVGTLLYAGWIVLFLRKRRNLDFKRFDAAAQNQSALVQLIQGMQDIKIANAETEKRWGWERIQAQLFKLNVRSLALNQYQQSGAVLLNEGKNILITFFAAPSRHSGRTHLGGHAGHSVHHWAAQ